MKRIHNRTGKGFRGCRRWLAALCLLSLFPLTAGAEDLRPLTLEEALRIAGDQNRDIQKAQEYIRWTEGKYVEERAAALPQFLLIGAASRSRDASQQTYPFTPTAVSGQRGSVSVQQALFTWGQVSAAIRAAKDGMGYATEQLRHYRQTVQREVAAAFYDILLAKELLRLARQNVDQKTRHLEEASKKFTLGVATDYDVLAAQVALENARPDQIRTENLLQTAREKLRFLLALEGEAAVDARGDLDTPILPKPVFAEALTVAKKQRPDLMALQRRLDISRELITIANSLDKPRLDLKGEYGVARIDPVGIGPNSGEVWGVGIQVSYPFFDGLRTRGKVAQAKSDLRSLQIDEAKLIDQISLQIRDALYAVGEAEQIVAALSGTVGQAERLLAMAEKGYALGVKIRLEVDDAEFNLLQSRGNLSKARRDYLTARVYLEWIMGTLGEGPESVAPSPQPASAGASLHSAS